MTGGKSGGIMIDYARTEDEASVYGLICDLEEEVLDRGSFRQIYQEYLSRPDLYCLVWREGGAAAAILTMRVGPALCRAGKVAEIMELTVGRSLRSRGIGHQLMKRAQELAVESGCIRMEVDSNRKREKAHRFYEREGMEKTHFKFVKRFENMLDKNMLDKNVLDKNVLDKNVLDENALDENVLDKNEE